MNESTVYLVLQQPRREGQHILVLETYSQIYSGRAGERYIRINKRAARREEEGRRLLYICLLYTSDAADE